MKNLSKINYRNLVVISLFILTLTAFFFHLISVPTTFLLCFGIGFIYVIRSIYEIYNMDFNISTNHLELKELIDDLSSRSI